MLANVFFNEWCQKYNKRRNGNDINANPSPTPDEIISCYLASFNIEMIPNIIGCAAAATIA